MRFRAQYDLKLQRLKTISKKVHDISETQELIAKSLTARQEHVASRLESHATVRLKPGESARNLVKASSARIREMLDRSTSTEPILHSEIDNTELSLADMHFTERLLSYIRHSVVRVSFYNLNLFCPSLLDEYDEVLRGEVVENMDQMPKVKDQLDKFFKTELPGGHTIQSNWSNTAQEVSATMAAIGRLAQSSLDRLDDDAIRKSFAEEMPKLIQQIMNALQYIQKDLDSRKMLVEDILREAVSMGQVQADEASLVLSLETSQTPKVFAERGLLLNAFTELIHNAVKYSGADKLRMALTTDSSKRFVELRFNDDGVGMRPEELETCLHRGVSHRGGTGEGLSMVVQIVEGEHLGEFQIESKPGEGCEIQIRLPIKYEPRQESNDA